MRRSTRQRHHHQLPLTPGRPGPAACTATPPMLIEISAAPDPPPRGHVRVDGGDPLPFTGWLQLLSILGGILPLPGTDTSGPGDGIP